MKTLFSIFVTLIIGVAALNAQTFETDQQAKSAIQKLSFLSGEWKGKGWRISQDGNKYHFDQSETVQFKLDSTALLIEGKGTAKGRLIHNALAVVTSEKESGNYEFQSFLQNGMKGSFKAELKDGNFYWYPNPNVRYIISINDKGQWHETGEYSRQGNWIQFFEMTLDRI
ncbi:hypothetical protein GCM10023115_49390 [Pontixanthobacter gangjinensis]|uniref:DUF1579 domain-containing protein n=1 Tax=Christiangramia aestuarii TaxID=1028746 RepID=A0A7K1LPM7_9FLAO|nr:hypothetical protein [Christiangramia aestuarii]MUP42520.1 hypothetical protein [Christiangramia aestuarii]